MAGGPAIGDVVGRRYELRAELLETPAYRSLRAFDREVEVEVDLWWVRDSACPDDRARTRFLDDVERVRALSEPHLRRIFDAAEVEGGVYLTCQLPTSEGLAAQLRTGQPLRFDFWDYVEALAGSLDVVHRGGMVHGRLTPRDIAHVIGRIKIGAAGLFAATDPGLWVGDGHYLAPEVRAGTASSRAADVYSMAAVLCEIAAGQIGLAARRRLADEQPALWAALDGALDELPENRPSGPLSLAGALGHLLGRELRGTPAPLDAGATEIDLGALPERDAAPGADATAIDLPAVSSDGEDRAARTELDLGVLPERDDLFADSVDEEETVFEGRPGGPLPRPAVPVRDDDDDDDDDGDHDAHLAHAEHAAAGEPGFHGQPGESGVHGPGQPGHQPGEPAAHGPGHPGHPVPTPPTRPLTDDLRFVSMKPEGDDPGAGRSTPILPVVDRPDGQPRLHPTGARPATDLGHIAPPRRAGVSPRWLLYLVVGIAAAVLGSLLVVAMSGGGSDGGAPALAGPDAAADIAPIAPRGGPTVEVLPAAPGRCPADMVFVDDPGVCVDAYESPGRGRLPATGISHEAAAAACAERDARLCSAAEWESACRGPDAASWPYGEAHRPGLCNVEGGAFEVAGARTDCRDPRGVFDMSGNVAEWVAEGDIRGGSARDASRGRCSQKRPRPERQRAYSDVGFRCCADPLAPPRRAR